MVQFLISYPHLVCHIYQFRHEYGQRVVRLYIGNIAGTQSLFIHDTLHCTIYLKLVSAAGLDLFKNSWLFLTHLVSLLYLWQSWFFLSSYLCFFRADTIFRVIFMKSLWMFWIKCGKYSIHDEEGVSCIQRCQIWIIISIFNITYADIEYTWIK